MSYPLLIALLAEGPKNTGPDVGKASPVGLFITVLLLIGVVALVRSMNRHLKRVPKSFDAPADGPAGDATASAATAPKSEPPVEGEPTDESGG